MPTYGFTITEHDAAKLWLIVKREHHSVDLEPGINLSGIGS